MIKLLKRKIFKSDFSKGVLTLVSGTALAQLIPFLIMPLLSRLYTPDDFGVFGLFMAISSLIAVIATGRYELAIVLPKRNKDAVNLLFVSILISVFISIITLIFFLLFSEQVSILLAEKKIKKWLLIVPILVLLIGLFQSLNYWANRQKSFGSISKAKISHSTSLSLVNLLFGFAKRTQSGLIFGQIFGRLMSVLTLLYTNIKSLNYYKKHISLKRSLYLAKRYKEFPLINSLQAFSDKSKESGIIFIITYFFSSSILGYYNFGLRAIQSPLLIIKASIAQVFYQKFSELKGFNQSLYPFFKKLFIKLLIMAIILLFSLFFLVRLFLKYFLEENGLKQLDM
ncbi:oligosaccharide flippase family protein [bacterium]|nr:oligosaccharide flippase family protein [bacterium]